MSSSKPANYDWAKDIPCKNITIYGYCKHEDKCAFKHDFQQESNGQQQKAQSAQQQTEVSPIVSKVAAAPIFTPSSSSNSNRGFTGTSAVLSSPYSAQLDGVVEKKKFNFDSPSFTPTTTSAATTGMASSTKYASPKVSEIQTFVPGDGAYGNDHSLQAQLQKFNIDTPSFLPSSANVVQQQQQPTQQQQQIQGIPGQFQQPPPPPPSQQQPTPQQQQQQQHLLHIQASQSQQQQPHVAQMHQQPVPHQPPGTNDVYFATQHAAAAAAAALTTSTYPLNYHLYAQPAPPHYHPHLAPFERDLNNLFIPASLRETLQRRNEAANQVLPQSNLPDHVNQYHSLVPIDKYYDVKGNGSMAFGGPETVRSTAVYKVQSSLDGKLYCMRKIELATQNIDEGFVAVIKRWGKVESANVVKPLEAFTSMAFNDNSLFVVYDYYPCAVTLNENHFRAMGTGRNPVVITETLLWSYLVQLTNALVAVHNAGVAVRCFDLSKIIVTSENRIKLSGCGVLDILRHDDAAQEEEVDLSRFAEVMLHISMTTMSTQVRATLRDATKEQLIARLPLSDEYKKALLFLHSPGSNLPELQSLIAPRLLQIVNGLQNSTDYMEAQLSREVENGRLFRLMAKLNFIVERPEFLQDETWSETGERYPIKLFHDYVFHQRTDTGKPSLDLGHVLTALNKLDAGIEEKLLLVSSDEKSCLIISYKELKELVETSFRELNS